MIYVGILYHHLVRLFAIAQITDEGNLECLYHGWQFEGAGGSCLKIPQVCTRHDDMVVPRFNDVVCCCRSLHIISVCFTYRSTQWEEATGVYVLSPSMYADDIEFHFVLRLS